MKQVLDILLYWCTFICCHNYICYARLNPSCSCVTFQGSDEKTSGLFTSPNYPQPYKNNVDCILYLFIAPHKESIIEIVFDDLDVGEINEYGNCNSGDKLRGYLEQPTPSISQASMPTTEMCGNLSMMLTRSLYSTTGVLILELESDENPAPHRGFKGTYKFIDADLFKTDGVRQAQSQCTYYIEAGAFKEGKIFSPNYPLNYPANSNCAWIFTGDWDERVQITFVHIELSTWGIANFSISPYNIIPDPNANRTCDIGDRNTDKITVHDGDNNAPMIARYCGSMDPQEIRSTGKEAVVKFSSNQYNGAMGFAALYKFIKLRPNSEISVSCDLEINSENSKSGVVTSTNYPEFYPSKSCVYNFHGNHRDRVVVSFEDFDLGGGPASGSRCLLRDRLLVKIFVNNTYPSTLIAFCGSDPPPRIMSNGPKLRLKFEAVTHDPQARGFKFRYSFVQDFGIQADSRQDHIMPCVNQYKASVRMAGNFTSPNYPGLYPRDTLCSYIFYGEGKRVQIEFKHFDVKGHPPQCLEEMNSDYVVLSNYNGAEDKKLSRFCSYTSSPEHILKETHISERDFYQVTFKAGRGGIGTGFRATYKFIDSGPSEASAEEQVVHKGSGKSSKYSPTSSLTFLTTTFLIYYWLVI